VTITERIDAITKIAPEYRGVFIPAPKSVKIELTANCNYKCSFCVKSLRPDDTTMDRAFYSRIIRELYASGVQELGVFYIGESFTCKWLPEAIAEAKDVGFPYVFLTTNGSASSPARVMECMQAGVDSLKFSLNFTDKKQFADVAQVDPRLYDKAISNIKQVWEVRERGGFKCGLYASSIAFDGDQGVKMQKLIDEIRPFVDEHYFLPLYGMQGASKAAGWKPQPGNPGRLDAMRPPLPCWSVSMEGHITSRGMLSACCFGKGVDDTLVMGDLNHTPFMQAWNSPKFQSLRQAHLDQEVSKTACAECAAG
jgi:MoaA/NifB/PqqE/SkfB family radical SAM enzyme